MQPADDADPFIDAAPMVPIWHLGEGIDLCRRIEQAMTNNFVGWHVALSGSVLFDGASTKDLDILFYPHNKKIKKLTKSKLLKFLKNTIGITVTRRASFAQYDKKIVYICEYQGRRIDLFFLK